MDEPVVLRTVPLVRETPEGLRWLRIGSLADGSIVYERNETLEQLATRRVVQLAFDELLREAA